MKVAVIGGGEAAESEVSRISANGVLNGLADRHDAKYFEFDRTLVEALFSWQPDVAFPITHGPHGEDGTIQGLLSAVQIPYVGSDLRASALGMDKHVAKMLFAERGISVLPGICVSASSTEQALNEIRIRFENKIVVKPLSQGSAIGVTLLPEGGDVRAALENALQYSDHALVEPFVPGREITVGVLDTSPGCPRAFPVIEIKVQEGDWYDYTNRYTAGKSSHVIPPPDFSQEQLQAISNAAISAHQALGCADFSRADFIVPADHDYVLLEVNTLPGMTPTSLYPDAAASADIGLPELLDRLVVSAAHRGLR